MLATLMPTACSRLGIFICYATPQRVRAEEIAQVLSNAGHTVFFDQQSLVASADYNDRIRRAIESADRFIFLASREALTPGRFTLTELAFAKERWPSADGHVFPVLIDPGLKIEDFPTYLRSVHAITVQGNVAAEVAAAIHKTRKIGVFCRTITALAATAVIAAGIGISLWQPPTDIAVLPIQKVQFRSTLEPPRRDATVNTPAWIDSKVTVTAMPLAYQHRTDPGRRARILNETLSLDFGGTLAPYRAYYVVEITDAACGERWYCIKGNAGPETLEPGKTISREVMFVSQADFAPNWKDFVNSILGHDGFKIKVEFVSAIEVQETTGATQKNVVRQCTIDVQALRAGLQRAGYTMENPNKPDYLQADCNR
jgi:hypothetical protein